VRELNKEEQLYVVCILLGFFSLNNKIEDFEIEGHVLRLGIGMEDIPKYLNV
jgi:hypothetical protein